MVDIYQTDFDFEGGFGQKFTIPFHRNQMLTSFARSERDTWAKLIAGSELIQKSAINRTKPSTLDKPDEARLFNSRRGLDRSGNTLQFCILDVQGNLWGGTDG